MSATTYNNFFGFETGDTSGLGGQPTSMHILCNGEARSGRFFMRWAKPTSGAGGKLISTLSGSGLDVVARSAPGQDTLNFGVGGWIRPKQYPNNDTTIMGASVGGIPVTLVMNSSGDVYATLSGVPLAGSVHMPLDTWTHVWIYTILAAGYADLDPCCLGPTTYVRATSSVSSVTDEVTTGGGPTWSVTDWSIGGTETSSIILDYDDIYIYGGPHNGLYGSTNNGLPGCGGHCVFVYLPAESVGPGPSRALPRVIMPVTGSFNVADCPVDTRTPATEEVVAVSALWRVWEDEIQTTTSTLAYRSDDPLMAGVAHTFVKVTINAKSSVNLSVHQMRLYLPRMAEIGGATNYYVDVAVPASYSVNANTPVGVFVLPHVDPYYLGDMEVGMTRVGAPTLTVGGGIVAEVWGEGAPVNPLTLPSADDGSGVVIRSCIQEYTGNGVAGRIMTFGFRPHVILVKPHGGGITLGVMWHVLMGASISVPIFSTATPSNLRQQAILATWSGGCYLGSSPEVNAVGVDYTIIALRDTGGYGSGALNRCLGYGVYVGTGAGRDVTFQPAPGYVADDVYILGNNTGGMFGRGDTLYAQGNLTIRGDGQSGDPAAGDTIFLSTGPQAFTVGTGNRVNQSGTSTAVNFYWFSFRRLLPVVAALFQSGTYAILTPLPTGVPRDVYGNFNFQPRLAICGGNGEPAKQGTWWKSATYPAGANGRRWTDTSSLGHITALGPGAQFSVDADLNQGGVTGGYLYWVFGGTNDGLCLGAPIYPPPSPPPPTGRPPHPPIVNPPDACVVPETTAIVPPPFGCGVPGADEAVY